MIQTHSYMATLAQSLPKTYQDKTKSSHYFGISQTMFFHTSHPVFPLYWHPAIPTIFSPWYYIKQINIDRQIYEKWFSNPIDSQLKFNIFSLNPVPWNPYWPPLVITDPEPEPSFYWQDSQDPYELDTVFDPEDFYVNKLRQGLPNQNSQPMPQPVPMDQNSPSHEQIRSHNSWLESLGYDFTLGADNSHFNLFDNDWWERWFPYV